MSLHSALTSTSRQKVPDSILAVCLPNDRIVLENILSVIQQIFPTASAAMAVITKINKAYKVVVPVQDLQVSMSDLKTLEAYSPSRLSEITISVVNANCHLTLNINDETAPLKVSEVEIVRVRKRVRILSPNDT